MEIAPIKNNRNNLFFSFSASLNTKGGNGENLYNFLLILVCWLVTVI